jgi:hypothetical protein
MERTLDQNISDLVDVDELRREVMPWASCSFLPRPERSCSAQFWEVNRGEHQRLVDR